jgi:hypothetical protein
MLNPSTVFSLAGLLAGVGWLGLIMSLFVRPARPITWAAAQLVIPAILATAYALLLWQGRTAFDVGGFGSIQQVRDLFANDSALAAGWLHYLAFDLFVGAWIARDGERNGVAAPLVLLCLPLTFLFGPAGLLLYLVFRLIFRTAQKETRQ